jgi:HK97 family phage major capsid protein
VNVGRENVAYPIGTAGATSYWLGDENTQITESQPAIGMISAFPKTLAAIGEISHQALRQTNAELVLRTELSRAAGAALTTAILQGSGLGGQPLGVIGPGAGSFTGPSLTATALRNAQADIAPAILDPSAVGYITTPTVAELLATRPRVSGSDRMLLEGASHDGVVEGLRTLTSTGCPAATLVVGDWSQVWVAEWAGGAQLLIDPFTKFTQGIVALRLLLLVDIIVVRASAFSIATSIT